MTICTSYSSIAAIFIVGLSVTGCSSGTPASREPTLPEKTETEPPPDAPVLSAKDREIVEKLQKGGGALHSP